MQESKAVDAEIVELDRDIVAFDNNLKQLEILMNKTFPPDKINQLIMDLCTADDSVFTKDGDERKTPNWAARKAGLEKVMGVLKYAKKESVTSDNAPSKIIIQVHQQAAPEVKRVREKKQK